MYKIPEKYYLRLHHVRPRFKRDIENVLLYIANEITKIGEKEIREFHEEVNKAIQLFPGNFDKKMKTINNWRTEISALFGFIIEDGYNAKPSNRALELSENEDLVEAFKKFLYTFQYPGGHIKNYEIKSLIENNVRFKPAQYLLKILTHAEKSESKRIYITKGEFCHCVVNDLRATSNKEDPSSTWRRIKTNRDSNIKYDLAGDVIRYAGDIIDYMEIANLLVTYDGYHYFLNRLENESILKFINSKEWFEGYNELSKESPVSLKKINETQYEWSEFINKKIEDTDFATDILALISDNKTEYRSLITQSAKLINEKLQDAHLLRTKDIGDMGESIVLGHEKQRVKEGGRSDLIHLIQKIPTQLAVGYDIQSIELNDIKRYIEVKTTISSKPIQFNKVHLTPNEWRTADSVKDRYFIYRLMISKEEKKLLVIQNPVGLYKKDIIEMFPQNGVELKFNDKAGRYEEVLMWKN